MCLWYTLLQSGKGKGDHGTHPRSAGERGHDALVTLNRAMQSQTTPYWVDLDLSLAQVKTLLALGDLGAPTIGEIATVLGVSQPTASHLVERLVQSELARRSEDAHNRRRTLVRLTPQGEEMLGHLIGYPGPCKHVR